MNRHNTLNTIIKPTTTMLNTLLKLAKTHKPHTLALSSAFIAILLITFHFQVTSKPANPTCSQMQHLDPQHLKTDNAINGDHINLTDAKGDQHWIKTSIPAKQTFSQNSDKDLEYLISLSQNLTLDHTQGFIIAKTLFGEELAMFRLPQGVDKKNNRVDYQYQLTPIDSNSPDNNYQLQVTPNRPWQTSCTKGDIVLHTPITLITDSEALVVVGQTKTQSGSPPDLSAEASAKDGDIITIKPAGWSWGLEERNRFAIVRVPKQTFDDRAKITSKTETTPVYDDPSLTPPQEIQEKIHQTAGLARYAIDYTKLATPEQLALIRDPQRESPTLDATKDTQVIQKKPDPALSIIPQDSLLAHTPKPGSSREPYTKLLAQSIKPLKQLAGLALTLSRIDTSKKLSISEITSFLHATHYLLHNIQFDQLSFQLHQDFLRLAAAVTPTAHAEDIITRSIGGALRDYSTIAAWETACGGGNNSPDPCDLTDTTSDTADIVRGELYADSVFAEAVVIDGFTTSTTAYPILTAAASDLHTGSAGTGAVVSPLAGGSAGHGIQIVDNNVHIEWLEVTNWTNTASSHNGIEVAGSAGNTGIFVDHVIVHDDGHGTQTNSDADGIMCDSADNTTATITNSIVYNIARQGIGLISCDDSTLNIYNNTAFNCRIEDSLNQYGCIGARVATNPTVNAINNIGMDAEGGASDFNDVGNTGFSSGTSNYNISSDGSAFGADIESGTATAGTNTLTFIDSAATFQTNSVVAGDWLNNDTRSSSAQIASVDSETQLTLKESITSQTSGDAYSVNKSAYYRIASDQFVRSSTSLAPGHDLHLKPSSDAINTGSDQSSNLTDSRDIDRDSRPQLGTWDIGADEFASRDPFAWYKFDEGADNTCPGGADSCDSSGLGHHGTNSAPLRRTSDQCVSGDCLEFDGSNDHVNIYSTDFNNAFNRDNGSISAWIKLNQVAWTDGFGHYIAIFRADTSNEIWLLKNTVDNEIRLLYEGGGTVKVADFTLTSGFTDWLHVAATWDTTADELKLFLNGQEVASNSSLGTWSGNLSSTNTNIGSLNTTGSGPWDGFIDDVKIYNYTRTPAEIKSDFNFGSAAVLGATDTSFLSNGLVGYWKMDEGALDTCTGGSNDFCDSSGNDQDGFENGSMTDSDWVNGKFSYGVDFDGSNDYVEINNFSSLLANSTGITIAGWVFPQSATDHDYFFGIRNDSNADFYVLRQSGSNNLECRFRNSAGTAFDASPAPTITEDVWQHVAFTYDGSTARCFINGQIQGTVAATGTITNTSVDMFLAGNTANFLNGDLDEVRAYNRALTPSEIRQLADWAPGPVGYWNLDENTGTTAFDRSGNGNNGTLEASMTETDWVAGKFGSALDFDGTDDNVDITDSSLFNFGDSSNDRPLSISAWIKPTDASNFNIVSNSTSDTLIEYVFKLSGSDDLLLTLWDDSTSVRERRVSSAALTNYEGEWVHVAATYDGGGGTTASDGINLYVNGAIVPSSTDDSGTYVAMHDESTTVRLGSHTTSTSSYSNGLIDDVRIYNYVRTPSQVVEDMNAGHPIGGSPVGSQVGYWKMDEGFGDSSNDTTVNGNTADLADTTSTCPTTGGCPTWRNEDQCKSGKCLDFDGTDDTLVVPNSSAIDLDDALAGGWTFTTWFYAHSDGENDLGRLFVKNGSYCRTDDESAGTVDIFCNADLVTTDASFTIPTRASLNTWNHIALAYTDDADDEITAWLNGVNQGNSTNGNGSVTADSFKLFMGGNPANDVFDGLLDDFKIYNKELSDSEVLIDMNANAAVNFGTFTKPGSELQGGAGNPPIGHWRLDENQGTGTDAVKDTSGNNNHGTTEASMTETDWVPGKHGSALDFDSHDDLVTVTDSSLFHFGDSSTDNPFTISSWVKARNFDSFHIFSNSASDSVLEYTLNTSGTGFLWLSLWDDANTARERRFSTSDLNGLENQWVHIAASYDGGGGTTASDGIVLYVNGVAVPSSTNDSGTYTAMHNESTTIEIGAHSIGGGTTYSDGIIDDVKIWDYELTPAQIAYSYNRGAPFAHWKLDDCQGTTAFDSGPSGVHGSITIGTTGTYTSPGTCNSGTSTEAWNAGTSGKRNFSLAFDGTNDYIDMGDNLIDGKSELSVAAWINASTISSSAPVHNISGNSVVDKGGASDDNLALYIGSNDEVNFYLDTGTDGSITTTTSPIGTGVWHHLVGTYDGSTMSIYVDGRFVTSTSHSGTIIDNANTLQISTSTAAATFDGLIDDVRLYSYALSPSQVKQIMNNGNVNFSN